MATTKAHMKATAKYEKNNDFKTLVRFKKEDEERIRAAAGDSLNGFIVNCVLDVINKAEERQTSTQAPEMPAELSKPASRDYLPLTSENIEKVDLDALLTGGTKYQIDIFDLYGPDGFNKLLEMAEEKRSRG